MSDDNQGGILAERMAANEARAREEQGLAPRDYEVRGSVAADLPPHDPATGEIHEQPNPVIGHGTGLPGAADPMLSGEAVEMAEFLEHPPEQPTINVIPPKPEPEYPPREPEHPGEEAARQREEPKQPPEPEITPGGRDPWSAATLGQTIDMLENGQFQTDALQAMIALGQGMTDLASRTNKVQKGRIVLTLHLKTEGDAHFVEAEFKVVAPKEPRRRSMLWQNEEGAFTPSLPKQRLFLGGAVPEHGPAMRQIGDVRERRDM